MGNFPKTKHLCSPNIRCVSGWGTSPQHLGSNYWKRSPRNFGWRNRKANFEL